MRCWLNNIKDRNAKDGAIPVVSVPLFDRLKYRAGIFDLRGTLVDLDGRYKKVLYLKTVRDFGRRTGNRYLSSFNESDLEQLLRMSASKRAEALERFGLDQETFNEAWLTDDALAIRMRYSQVQPDARVLRVLKSKGVKLGIVTSAVKRAADMDVGLLKGKIGSRIFDEVVMTSYEPTLAPKPDPSAIRACMARMSVSPDQTFGVGNSDRDIAAYKAAGILDILIERPGALEMGASVERGLKASIKISSLEELIPIVIQRGWVSRLLWRRPVPSAV